MWYSIYCSSSTVSTLYGLTVMQYSVSTNVLMKFLKFCFTIKFLFNIFTQLGGPGVRHWTLTMSVLGLTASHICVQIFLLTDWSINLCQMRTFWKVKYTGSPPLFHVGALYHPSLHKHPIAGGTDIYHGCPNSRNGF